MSAYMDSLGEYHGEAKFKRYDLVTVYDPYARKIITAIVRDVNYPNEHNIDMGVEYSIEGPEVCKSAWYPENELEKKIEYLG